MSLPGDINDVWIMLGPLFVPLWLLFILPDDEDIGSEQKLDQLFFHFRMELMATRGSI